MATFLISGFSFQKYNVEKHKNGHNSVILAQNEKIRPLYILQLKSWRKQNIFFYLGLLDGHFVILGK